MRRGFILCLAIAFVLFSAVLEAATTVEYQGASYPDPFVDPNEPHARPDAKNSAESGPDAAKKLQASAIVQGVLVSPDGNMAIVNGKVTRVGGSVMGHKVEAIEPHGVTVILSGDTGGKRVKLLHKGKVLS